MTQDLDGARYLNLATFRKTGQRVETPVWFAQGGGNIYVFSEGDAGKVKRLRHTTRVEVAACGVRGRLRGAWIEMEGRLVEGEDTKRVGYGALHVKYGYQMKILDFFSRIFGHFDRRVLIEISKC